MHDNFKRTIIDIIDYEKPKTVPELSIKMDECGYYGRHQILQINDKVIGKNKLKIKIYLPDSKLTYSWPYNNYYILGIGFEKNRPRARDPVSKRLMIAIKDHGYESLFILKEKAYTSYENVKKYGRIIEKHGMIDRNNLRLKSYVDIVEYYENMMNGY